MNYLMIFKEEFHPKIKSDLKQIDKGVVEKIKILHLNNILQDPCRYEPLKGSLSNLYSYHFRENKVEYRIAYEVKEETVIFYYMIGKRENLYKNIETRI
ncbi:type II toxin-antitoxin system mRNA interferase toxin, RelE/StbE family [Sulfurimonas sp. RIFOXYB12_FULL_35_9]|uniref:type II toxin-antitoxin system mRNA interferase toxin, RelE/StbE family n=1 Tax=Sulfurimonas sp. RIFOXYB12_FULL_35_9 TaxID=1802256 RepID=UPI0025CF140F|nr:type II toxin-antitoxin system mRNA interferase toxin, RelE/StbE family [Sulfurimonas sp. RIFOXYB12_FULL_35_9]